MHMPPARTLRLTQPLIKNAPFKLTKLKEQTGRAVRQWPHAKAADRPEDGAPSRARGDPKPRIQFVALADVREVVCIDGLYVYP